MQRHPDFFWVFLYVGQGLEGRSATARGGVEKIFEDTKIIGDQVPHRPSLAQVSKLARALNYRLTVAVHLSP